MMVMQTRILIGSQLLKRGKMLAMVELGGLLQKGGSMLS